MQGRLVLCCVGFMAMICGGCRTGAQSRFLVWEFVDVDGVQLTGAWKPERIADFKSRVETNERSGVLTVRDGKGVQCVVAEYVRGQRVSDISYYQSGAVREKASYTNGLLNGVFFHYWENGQIWVQASYREGVCDGPFRAWAANGKRTHDGGYTNGKEHGIWIRWINDETIMEKEMWEDGELISCERYEGGKRVPSVMDSLESRQEQGAHRDK
jgi:hypothetical protein